jgi:hypothetical protein
LFVPGISKLEAKNPNAKPKHAGRFLIDQRDPQMAAIYACMQEVAAAKWGVNGPAMFAALWGANATCLHDGNLKPNIDGHAYHWYVNGSAAEGNPPDVRDLNASKITDPRLGRPYNGCMVNVVLDIYAQDNEFGKRINAGLLGVQFVADGDKFRMGEAAEDTDFANYGDYQGADAFAGGFPTQPAVQPGFPVQPATPLQQGQTQPGFPTQQAVPAAQPQFAQPAAQPQFAQPAAQPQFAQPAAQPQFAQPAAQPQFAPPAGQPGTFAPPRGF